jgi:peptide/nickel transport system permease protein
MRGGTENATTVREPPSGAAEGRPTRRWGAVIGILGSYALTALALVTLIFFLPRAMPGDPLAVLIDPDSGTTFLDEDTRARVEAHYGLDRPLPDQYVDYLTSVATGDLGWSISRSAPVSELIGDHLPWTLLLMGVSLALAGLLSFVAGVAAAWHRNKPMDRMVLALLTTARAVPEFALASGLLIVFAVFVPWFPISGGRTPFAEYSSWWEGFFDIARHAALPVTALTIGLMGSKFLLVRNTMIGELGQDYMLLARAKGLADRRLKYHHAGRNALLPFLTVMGVQVGFLVGGSVFVETVFAYPGMGSLILRSIEARDYPLMEGVFLVLSLTVLVSNLVVDLVYARLDPRTRS